jgi:heat shock protein HtpX
MNALKTAALMAMMTILLVVIGRAVGGQQGMIIAFALAVVLNIGSYWFSDKIVLARYRGHEVTEAEAPRLHHIVRELTLRAGLPMPRVYIVPTRTPNAFATGRNPKHAAVAVTQGIMQLLNENELRGVIGHELSHVKHRDILIGSIAATIAGAISVLGFMGRWALIFGGFGGRDGNRNGGGLGALLMVIVAPIAAMMIQMAISRSREFAADASGARLAGNPRDLASALEKLQQASKKIPMRADPATAHMFTISPLSGKGLMSLFSTHPSTEERIRRLEHLHL